MKRRAGGAGYANPAALKLLEAESPADIVGQSVKRWAVEEFKLVLEERVRGISRSETQPLREIQLRTTRGNIIDVEVTSTPGEINGKRRTHTIARDITERKKAQLDREEGAQATARAVEMERSRTRILMVSESVRKEIGRHLHGTVQNRLIIFLHRLTRLKDYESGLDQTVELDEVVRDLADLIEEDVRKMSSKIYPDILRRGLAASLRSLGDHISRGARFKLDMELDRALEAIETRNTDLVPETIRLAIYRIAEEALTNALKHSNAQTVRVRVTCPEPDTLKLEVSDDGRGFDEAETLGGIGVALMADYASASGGHFAISSAPGNGSLVGATLPLLQDGAGLRVPNDIRLRKSRGAAPVQKPRAPLSCLASRWYRWIQFAETDR